MFDYFYPAEDAVSSLSILYGRGYSVSSPCKFNTALKSWPPININVFPTPRFQAPEGVFQKSFRELLDILSSQLTGKSDSETRKKEEKEGLGEAREERKGDQKGPGGGWSWAGASAQRILGIAALPGAF